MKIGTKNRKFFDKFGFLNVEIENQIKAKIGNFCIHSPFQIFWRKAK